MVLVVFLATGFFLAVGFMGAGFGSSTTGGLATGVGTRGLALRREATNSMANTVTSEDVTATSTTWEDVTSQPYRLGVILCAKPAVLTTGKGKRGTIDPRLRPNGRSTGIVRE